MSILTLEVVEPFTVKEHGQVSSWQAGQRMVLSLEKAQRVIDRVGHKVRVVDPETLDPAPHLDPLIGSIVTCADRRGLVRDVHLAEATRWFWVETATDTCWTRAVTEGSRCRRCQGLHWWWSKDAAIRCGFSHEWVDPPRDPKTGNARGIGGPADQDHLDECCGHRFRFTRTLAILCAACHPPTLSPDEWPWREIAELRSGLGDLVSVTEGLACDDAFSQGDYSAFLRHRERLAAWVGQVVRLKG